MMKKLLFILLFALGTTIPTEAQSWKEIFGSLFGGNSSKNETTTVVTKYPSEKQLAASWSYAEAVIDYTGDDLLATMAVSALEGQVEGYCTKAGIVAGRDRILFKRNGGVEVNISDHKAEGTYCYDAERGALTLEVAWVGQTATLTGEATYESGVLTLLFKAESVIATMKAASPKLAENDHVKMAAAVVASYPGIQIGARFKR